MQRALSRLSSETFDVLIIGGGATGCFTARDCALRGLKVALVEARDFASATDLPEGARNLGWVEVPQLESDEASFLELRKRICELGGDALSQAAWVKGPGDEQRVLTANAWALP